MTSKHLKIPPLISCSPRASLDADTHASIDAILKDMKIEMRHLHAVFSLYQKEVQILQRLYYKGKNQHRSALFWKRFSEMKRYSERLNGLAILEDLERLRSSFFGATTTILSSKAMRGSWTNIPDSASVAFVDGKLFACPPLLIKFRERLIVAYRSYKLAMQTGAFIQLILILAAIASRIDALIPQILDCISSLQTTVHRLLIIVDPAVRSQGPEVIPRRMSASVGVHATQERFQTTTPSLQHVLLDSQDIGQLIVRKRTQMEVDLLPQSVLEGSSEGVNDDSIVVSTKMIESVTFDSKAKDCEDIEHRALTKRPASSATRQTKRRKAKDPIDDIFGF